MTEVGTPQQLFPTLSEVDIKRRSEAERRLPTWLSQPTQFQASNLVNESQEIEDFAEHIDQELINHLKVNLNVHKLFPVQRCLIPVLAKQFKSRPLRRTNDICVSSPTGSGKTLSYVIPIVNALKHSLARELRAIVVLPTRDLAQQVFKTFNQVAQPTHLRCALATDETQSFFRKLPSYTEETCGAHINTITHSGSDLIAQNPYPDTIVSENDYVSTIDILISTPGTLVDLIQNSPDFLLKDLQVLVIDEADRLMVNHKHDWLNAIERAVMPKIYECPCKNPKLSNYYSEPSESVEYANYFTANGCTMRHTSNSRYLQKLLFSATLSSDPQILMHMNLFQPRLFLATKPSLTSTKIRNSLGTPASTPAGSPAPIRSMVHTPVSGTVVGKSELLTTMAIPEQLEEKMFITDTKDKLYVMWYIMHELKYKKVLCFTNDKKKCWELSMFLNEIVDVRAINFSSEAKPEARQKYLKEFKNGKLDVIVATDLIGRGMDIEGIEYVISYDMPLSGTWYAHRVGRTARAGNKGTAITLVDCKQLVLFKKVVQSAHKKPNSMRLSDVVEEMKIPHYSQKDEKRDNYIKTYENYKDKLNAIKIRNAKYKNKY